MADVKSNIVDLEVVYKNLNTTIDKNIELLKQGASAVDAYNKKISVVPSEFQKSLTDIKTKTDAVTKSSEQSRLAEIQLQKAREQAFDKFEQSLIKQEKLSQKNAQKQIDESNRIIAQKEKEFAKFEKEFNKYEADLAKKAIAEQKANQKSIQLAEQARLKELQLAKQREQAFDKYDAKLAREQAKLQASQNLYNKTQQQLNKVQQAYNNLAVKKERYNNLTAFEEARLKTLQVVTEKYNTTLKGVDATVGKHTRNVGNYASGFNPLSNSINQLTREMPAFTYSVQTGFMALSNNLPIFFDAMGQAVAQQKELQKQGLPSKNALQLIAGGLFSLGTALSVGITLLTVYGAEVIDFITGSKKKKEAIEQEKKAIEEKQKAEEQARETTAGFQSSELVRSKTLFENAKNLTLTYTERKNAINELRERYPEYLKNLTDEQILAGNTADAENALNEALIKRGVALAAQEMLQKNLTDELKLRLKNAELLKQSLEDQQAIIEQGNEIVIYTDKQKSAEQQKEALARKARKEQYNNYVQSILALRNEREAIIATYNENAKYLGVVNESTKATEKNTKAKKEAEIYQVGSVKWLQQQISQLKELNDTLSTTSEAYKVGAGAIQFYEQWLERLTGTAKKAKEELDGVSLDLGGSEFLTDAEGDEIMEAGNKLRQTIKDLKSDFIDTFASESGFSGLLEIMAGGLDKFEGDALSTALVISEAFQEAFNTISEASQRNFDAEYARLEEQRDFAIDMAGGSATAREEIERQYDEKRRAIQRREAEAQKRLALFNILINTAQAVVSALPNIPLSIAIGVIGAVQAGIVASQEIPQFWRGTENAPEGLAWTQEKGAEVITDKSGNVKTLGSNKGAQLTYLSKGDKVYKSHEDYINKVLSKNGIDDLGSYINLAPQKEVNNSFDMVEMKQEFSKLASVIKNKEGVNISIDKKGFLTKKGNTEFINSRLNLKSRQV